MCIIVEKNYNKKLDDGTIVVMRYAIDLTSLNGLFK